MILVVNAGSSSVKFGLFSFDNLELIARGLLDWAGSSTQAVMTITPQRGEVVRTQIEVQGYRSAIVSGFELFGQAGLINNRQSIRVVGHRLIHGGEEFHHPVWINSVMKKNIEKYKHLAPLHIPPGLEAIEAIQEILASVPQVGLFDTAFFSDIPPKAYLYPVPYRWYEQWGIRRYGFHGISHAYSTDRATAMLGDNRSDLRLVICHLGQGSSATAVRNGKVVTNTMGFTPLDGLMMGTRCGMVDPGILLYMLREKKISVEQLDDILHQQSGLFGISGVSSDFRQVEDAAGHGDHRSRLALDVYAYRIEMAIGALAATISGIDSLVFTGGIGEHASMLRLNICKNLEFLGVQIDEDRNRDSLPDSDIAKKDSPVRILIIHSQEDLMIATESRRMMLE